MHKPGTCFFLHAVGNLWLNILSYTSIDANLGKKERKVTIFYISLFDEKSLISVFFQQGKWVITLLNKNQLFSSNNDM